ncbi:MAG: T9SS type A sorting domain-containing protein, partial [Bacteroidota bacterium]
VIPGDSGFVKVNVLTTHEGWAHFKIRVFNYNEPSDADTVQFWFNGLASVNSNEPGPHISIYPNPIVEGGKLNLDQLSEQTKITILNSSGQTVFGTVAGKTSISIDMNLVKGIYFLRLDNGEHHENRKIIVY